HRYRGYRFDLPGTECGARLSRIGAAERAAAAAALAKVGIVMLHVYAAVSRPSGDMRGVDGRLLEFLPVEGLALAVSRHDEAPAPTAERLRAHARVNLALLGAPFRYGSHAADEDALRQQVRPDEL